MLASRGWHPVIEGYPSSSRRSRRCWTRRSAGRKERAAVEIIETEGTGNTMQITLELPEDIAEVFESKWSDLARAALEGLALEAYRSHALTAA